MSENVIISLIAGAFSVIAVIISVISSIRIHYLSVKVQKRKEMDEIEILTSSFFEPLFRSSIELRSRLQNIIYNEFCCFYYTNERTNRYYILSTTYLISQFFAVIEISRKFESKIFLYDSEYIDKILINMKRVSASFSSDSDQGAIIIHLLEQRALGEYIIENEQIIGYNKFVDKFHINQNEFVKYVVNDLVILAESEDKSNLFSRLKKIDSILAEMIESLEPIVKFEDRKNNDKQASTRKTRAFLASGDLRPRRHSETQ